MDDAKGREASRWRLFDDMSPHLDRFGLVLAFTIAAVVTLSLVDLRTSPDDFVGEIGLLVVTLCVSGAFLLTLISSGVSRRYRLVADALVGLGVLVAVGLAIAELANGVETIDVTVATPTLWMVLAAISPVVVIRRLIHHRRATAQTLLGAVSAYLLIAIAYDFSYQLLDRIGPTHFFGTEEPTTSFMYYSLVTITTVGYGDLSTTDPVGRMLSTTEAVVGQVYLVTFVAMVVGLLVAERRERRGGED